MEENFTWGGHISIVLTLLMISGPLFWRFPYLTFAFGGSAYIIISGIFLIVFAVPTMSLQVSKAECHLSTDDFSRQELIKTITIVWKQNHSMRKMMKLYCSMEHKNEGTFDNISRFLTSKWKDQWSSDAEAEAEVPEPAISYRK